MVALKDEQMVEHWVVTMAAKKFGKKAVSWVVSKVLNLVALMDSTGKYSVA